jgi:competence protein ComFC
MYAGLAEQAVHSLKFERNRSMAEALARNMAGLCPSGIITHVPTANRRVRQRGYDQAQLIARALATATANPYMVLLQRRGTQRQLGQSRGVRQTQLRDAFHCGGIQAPRDSPVVLVDDVLTTGSTFDAAAQTLRAAGYTSIHAVAFAWAA